MKNIQITLHDAKLEQTMLRLMQQQHQDLQELVITALQHYIKTLENPIPYRDPLQYAQKPTKNFQAIINTDTIFNDVENSATFAKELRQRAWKDE